MDAAREAPAPCMAGPTSLFRVATAEGRSPSRRLPLPSHRLPHRIANGFGCGGEVTLRRRDAGVPHQFLHLQHINATFCETATALGFFSLLSGRRAETAPKCILLS